MYGGSLHHLKRQLIVVAITFLISLVLLCTFLALWIIWIVRYNESDGFLSWPLWIFIFLLISTLGIFFTIIQRLIVYLLAIRAEKQALQTVSVIAQMYPKYEPHIVKRITSDQYSTRQSCSGSFVLGNSTCLQNRLPLEEEIYQPPPNVFVYGQQRPPPFNPEYFVPQQPTSNEDNKDDKYSKSY